MNKPTPLKAIRARCINCSGFNLKLVRECPFDGVNEQLCPLYPLRMGKGSRATLKKIRAYCLWCCSGQKQEVKLCPAVDCPLWEYRFGKRFRSTPNNALFLSEISMTEGVSTTHREQHEEMY
jgi:hypothetical protein